MRLTFAALRKRGGRLLVLACALAVLIPPVTAYAATQFTYASGAYGVGGVYHTTGYNPRQYNQVWHKSGKSWEVWYDTGNNAYCVVYNSSNPTRCGNPISYDARAEAWNLDDNSGVTWTAQTTVP